MKTFPFERGTCVSLLAAGHIKCVSAGPRGLDWIALVVKFLFSTWAPLSCFQCYVTCVDDSSPFNLKAFNPQHVCFIISVSAPRPALMEPEEADLMQVV